MVMIQENQNKYRVMEKLQDFKKSWNFENLGKNVCFDSVKMWRL